MPGSPTLTNLDKTQQSGFLTSTSSTSNLLVTESTQVESVRKTPLLATPWNESPLDQSPLQESPLQRSPIQLEPTQSSITDIDSKTAKTPKVKVGHKTVKIDVFDEEIPTSSIVATVARSNIRSKYKFLPFSLLAASFGNNEPDENKVKSDKKSKSLRRHTKKCRALNRVRHFPDPDFTKRIKRNDKRFLAKVEEYKQKRLITDCKCEEKKFACWEDFTYRTGRFFRFLGRLIFLICCPPCPSNFFHKLAFWPPARDYFFFFNDDPTKKNAEAVQTATVKLRKATKSSITFNKNTWRFGFEHNCFSEILDIECFIVETKAGNFLGCVFVKSPHANPRYTLLFSHPNGSDISDHLTGIPSLQDTAAFLNVNICAYDYSGYGISSGRPSESNLNFDIDAVYNHLRTAKKLSSDSIILWGFSIGTAATVNLAAELDDIAGVILFAPPTSMVRALCWKRFCCCQREQPCNTTKKACSVDKFNTIGKINKINTPLLICHGIEDGIVPIEHGQALYQHSNTKISPLWVPEVGHNNLENSELLWMRVREFIRNEAKSCLVTAVDEYDIDSRSRKKKRKSKRKEESRQSSKKRTSKKSPHTKSDKKKSKSKVSPKKLSTSRD